MFYIIRENGLAHISNDMAEGYMEFEVGEEPKELEEALLLEVNNTSKLIEYKTYLSSTDWYYTRKIETGESIPEDVTIKRAEAREFIRSQEDV